MIDEFYQSVTHRSSLITHQSVYLGFVLPSTDRNQLVLNTFEGGFVMAFRRPVRVLCLLMILSLVAMPLLAANGRISGRISRSDGTGIGGVIVQVVELSRAVITESDGTFVLDVPPGTYTLNLVAGDQAKIGRAHV